MCKSIFWHFQDQILPNKDLRSIRDTKISPRVWFRRLKLIGMRQVHILEFPSYECRWQPGMSWCSLAVLVSGSQKGRLSKSSWHVDDANLGPGPIATISLCVHDLISKFLIMPSYLLRN